MLMLFASPVLKQIARMGYTVGVIHLDGAHILRAWNESWRHEVLLPPNWRDDEESTHRAVCELAELVGIDLEDR